jgi:hypothetical protein
LKNKLKLFYKKADPEDQLLLFIRIYYLLSAFLKKITYAPYNTIAAIAIYKTFSAGPVAGVTIFSGSFSHLFASAL